MAVFTPLIPARRRAAMLCALLVSAFSATAMSGDWFAAVWTTDDGMPDNGVRAVTQTKDGFLWVATDGGLARFDGARFQKFPLLNIAVENSAVGRLLVDDRQQLWIAMNRSA